MSDCEKNMARSFMKLRTLVKMTGSCLGLGALITVPAWVSNHQMVFAQQDNLCDTVYSPGWNFDWDRRDPDVLPITSSFKHTVLDDLSKKPMHVAGPVRNILLICNANCEINATCLEKDNLTEIGKTQARHLGARLQSLGVQFNKVYVSSMKRTLETLTIISGFIVNDELNIDSLFSDPLLNDGIPCDPSPSPPSKISPPEIHADCPRIEAAFRKYIHRADSSQKENSTEIIICPKNIIQYFVCRALQLPKEGWTRMSVNNASITWLSVDPSGIVTLKCMGDTGHIPPNKITSELDWNKLEPPENTVLS